MRDVIFIVFPRQSNLVRLDYSIFFNGMVSKTPQSEIITKNLDEVDDEKSVFKTVSNFTLRTKKFLAQKQSINT